MYSTERPLFDNGNLYTTHTNFPTWEDVAFKLIWWIALGWAAAEAVVGIKQGYENIVLYKDVLVSVHTYSLDPQHGCSCRDWASGDFKPRSRYQKMVGEERNFG